MRAPRTILAGFLVTIALVVARFGGAGSHDTAVLWVGATVKLAALAGATWAAAAAARAFEPGDRPRRSFAVLGAGLGAFTGGQLLLARSQLGGGDPLAFPSPADFAFLLATGLLFAAFADFLGAYREAGLGAAPGGRGRQAVLGVAGVAFLAGAPVTLAVLRADAPLVERLVNAAYVALDGALLVAAAGIFVMVRRLAGGVLAPPWAVLGAGLVLTALGDASFAAVSVLGATALEPALDLCFMASYLCFAWGGVALRRIVTA